MQHFSKLVWLITWLLLLASCTSANEDEASNLPASTQLPASTTQAATAVASSAATPENVNIANPITRTQTSLTLWVPSEIWASSEPGQATLNSQLNSYRASHPELNLQVELKSANGQGSIVNYLITGRTIAPSILPDLIAIPTDQLASAASQGLIYPINNDVDAAYFEDVYPAGLQLVTADDQILGYPFILSQVSHLVYNSAAITQTVPITWTQFIEQPQQFAFPANGNFGATLVLQMYLDNGGQLTNEAGQVELQLAPLAAALQQLSDAREKRFILPQSSNLQTLEDTWQLFQAGTVGFVQATGSQYLRMRDNAGPTAVTAVPGQIDTLPSLLNGWAWAISTQDPAKRPLAADLLSFLIEPQNLGEWSYQNRQLPARQGAFFYWPANDPYVPFISNELLKANPHPFTSGHPVMLALNDAAFDVLTLAKTPQLAAEDAVAALQP